MANDLNQCSFIGRLGADVEMIHGDSIASFSIAVGSAWKDKNTGEKRESTEWIRVSAFGKQAEICGKYLVKGSRIHVTGRFKTSEYEKNGEKRYSSGIVLERMQMLDTKSSGGDEQRSQRKPASQEPDMIDGSGFDDDIPF
jgi:single-strand DNA-binding protein